MTSIRKANLLAGLNRPWNFGGYMRLLHLPVLVLAADVRKKSRGPRAAGLRRKLRPPLVARGKLLWHKLVLVEIYICFQTGQEKVFRAAWSSMCLVVLSNLTHFELTKHNPLNSIFESLNKLIFSLENWKIISNNPYPNRFFTVFFFGFFENFASEALEAKTSGAALATTCAGTAFGRSPAAWPTFGSAKGGAKGADGLDGKLLGIWKELFRGLKIRQNLRGLLLDVVRFSCFPSSSKMF